MKRNETNPFRYGGVVGGKAFCNRRREIADLLRVMENGESVFVYSERRMGKTSLVRRCLERLPGKRILCAYVDLWPTDGEGSFAAAAAAAMAEGLAGTAGRMLQAAKVFFGSLRPVLTTTDDGKPEITFGFDRSGLPGPQLDEVLSAPARIAARRKSRVVIVFDEVQRILEYGSDLVERRLRSAVQNHEDVAYVFLGSRKHLVQKMFLDRSRPLYRVGGHYPLGPIAVKDWLPFIRRRFAEFGRTIGSDRIRALCGLTGGHPFYTQHLCHGLWELTQRGGEVTEGMVEDAVRLLLERESYAYSSLWESLTINQRRFLRGLAAEPSGVKVFAADFVRRYGLQSSSSAQRAAGALLERDVIDRDGAAFLIADRFFRIWIGRMRP